MDYFDYEDQQAEAFYATAEPCESCGVPCFTARRWDADYELWIGTECSCNIPVEPLCSVLALLLAQAETAGQLCELFKRHAATCEKCKVPTVQPEAGPFKIPEAA